MGLGQLSFNHYSIIVKLNPLNFYYVLVLLYILENINSFYGSQLAYDSNMDHLHIMDEKIEDRENK